MNIKEIIFVATTLIVVVLGSIFITKEVKNSLKGLDTVNILEDSYGKTLITTTEDIKTKYKDFILNSRDGKEGWINWRAWITGYMGSIDIAVNIVNEKLSTDPGNVAAEKLLGILVDTIGKLVLLGNSLDDGEALYEEILLVIKSNELDRIPSLEEKRVDWAQEVSIIIRETQEAVNNSINQIEAMKSGV